MKRNCLCFTFCLISLVCQSQTKYNVDIKIDTVTGLPIEPLPFDQSFVLRFPISSNEKIGGLEYIPLIRRKGVGETIEKYSKRRKNGYHVPRVSSENFTYSTEGKQRYLIAKIPTEHALKPSKNYAFLLNIFSHDEFEMFKAYHEYSITADNSKFIEAAVIYNKLRKKDLEIVKLKSVSYTFRGAGPIACPCVTPACAGPAPCPCPCAIPLTNNFSSAIDDPTLDDLKSVYDGKIDQDLVAFLSAESALRAYVAPIGTHAQFQNSAIIKSIVSYFSKNDALLNSDFRKKYLVENQAFLSRLQFLISLDKQKYDDLLSGLINMDCLGCESTDVNKVFDRQSNLKSSIKSATDIRQMIILLDQRGVAGMAGVIVDLNTLIDQLVNCGKYVEIMITSYDSVVDKLSKNEFLTTRLISGGNTYNYNFETRTKLSIAPDFGFVTTRFSNDGSNPYPFVPYVGIHVNPRPLNRDIPYQSYKKNLWQRISFLAGFTLVSLNNGPNITKNIETDSVKSFFDKSTLLTGAGFRLGNAVRITFGTMWYFKYYKNVNKLNVYDDRKLKFWPFLGVTLDLVPKSLFEGIDTIFSTSPRKFIPATETQ